jgi:excisionase family DNA binding protein
MVEKLLTIDDFADILGISYSTAALYLREGRVKGIRLPVGWRITPEAVDEYIEKYRRKE